MNKKDLYNRIIEIDRETFSLASASGYDIVDIKKNPDDKPLNILEPIYWLLTEKLRLQKLLFEAQGNDLSNVVFLNEHATNFYDE